MREPRGAARRSFRLGLGVGVGATFELLPAAAPLLELEARAEWQRWGLALAGRHVFGVESRDDEGVGVRIRGSGAQLNGLFRPVPAVEARLGLWAHRLTARGLGVPRAEDDAAWAAGPVLGLGWMPLRSGWIWAGVGGEVHLDVVRPHFEIRNYGEVHAVPALGGSVFLRVGAQFL